MESMGISSGEIIVGISFILGGFIVGVPMIAFGQLISVFREIALNTRKENGPQENQYRTLESLAGIISAIGWITIIGGFLLGSMAIIA